MVLVWNVNEHSHLALIPENLRVAVVCGLGLAALVSFLEASRSQEHQMREILATRAYWEDRDGRE